jgi:hypothetical protein
MTPRPGGILNRTKVSPHREARENSVSLLGKNLEDMAASLSALARQAVSSYAPIVESIVQDKSTDIRNIEHTLDGLLDFCFNSEALLLYKKLCHHYYAIDPSATAEYVQAYREMWDSEPQEAS